MIGQWILTVNARVDVLRILVIFRFYLLWSSFLCEFLHSMLNGIWNESYMNCGYEIKWSYDLRSYERNFCNCVEKPEKFRTSTGFELVTSRFRCDALTNWAMKPLTLGAGHLSVLMVPWGINQWWMVYEMNHIWTADMKSSEAMIFAVMNAIFAIAWRGLKNSGLQRALNSWPRDSGATL